MTHSNEYRCVFCATLLEYTIIGFRDICPKCNRALHCCLMCKFYSPGLYNDCSEPQAERVVDKAAANFCDYFKLGLRSEIEKPSDNLKKLEDLFKK